MSRLNDLLRELRAKDPALAADIEREVAALADRRAFGLNFERHVPEVVELPGRAVRRGDKVRILPPRGTAPTKVDEKLWRVATVTRDDEPTTASLEALDGDGTADSSVADLVVVAEFRDPIYPGLVSTGKVERGGDKPFHTVINAENYYALQALLFAHRDKVDCIYIDPPYNTRDNDWKYNNNYVDADDMYRHSKWLAFMERRLLLAKELLDPDDSVLIVTIDDNEYARLLLLLDQVFPDGRVTGVSAVINPKGTPEHGFARVDEHVIFVAFGRAAPIKVFDPMLGEPPSLTSVRVRWRGLTRTGANGVRAKSPGAYYPIFIRVSDGTIHSCGEVPPPDSDGRDVVSPAGTIAVWPTSRPDGTLGRWSVVNSKFEELLALGAAKTGKVDIATGQFPLWYLTDANLRSIETGKIIVTGRSDDGALIVEYADADSKRTAPRTVWSRAAHSASESGSGLLNVMVPGRTFPYPKSLYSVEDALRSFIGDKKEAVVVDFFAGSGTTAHAVMRLNRQDDGCRRSVTVTNNEVSADELKSLRDRGLRPGDPEWEAAGICEYITKPRITAAITGQTFSGEPIGGEYKIPDQFSIADGFEENVEFFTITYEAPLRVASNREFAKIAPLLWMRAGSRGRRIDDISVGWDVADAYGVLANLDRTDEFLTALGRAHALTMAFIVTDEDRLFEAVVRDLPDHIEPVRLYEAYLRNFEIEVDRSTL